MRSLALLVAALVAASAFAPVTLAQVPPLPLPGLPGSDPGNNTTEPTTVTPVQLFLSRATTTAGNATAFTLTTTTPAAADTARINASDDNATWVAAPGSVPALTNVVLTGDANGVTWISYTPGDPVPVGLLANATLTFTLLRVRADGTQEALGAADASVSPTPLIGGPTITDVAWTIPGLNATLAPGEGLAFDLGVTQAPSLNAAIEVLFDSADRPSNLTVGLVAAPAIGNLQLSSTTLNREAAPGSSPTYVVSVRNLGDQPDTVRVNATSNQNDWQVRINPGQLTLSGASAGSVLVTVVIPATATDGTQQVTTVRAESSLGGAPQTLQLTTTARGSRTCPGDQDCDGYSDLDERRYSSAVADPTQTPDNTDSDGDGVNNKPEVDAGTDPFDPNDFPGSGDGGTGTGNAGPGGGSLLSPLSDPIAQATGVDPATADLLALLLILLFLIIVAGLLWFFLAAYPVSVSLVEAKAVTEPGRGADYAVEVRSRLGRQQQVDLEAAGLPSDWDVRFNKPHLTLEAKQSETVGMLIRPPDGWPAPTKRDFEVRARSRIKPGTFAKTVAKLLIQPRPVGAVEPPLEQAVQEEPAAQAYAPPEPAPAYVPPAPVSGGAFRVRIGDVRHNPEVPERGGEVTTTARVDNQGSGAERVRLVLVVNGKVRDEVRVDLEPGEGAEAEFHWVAYLARNEVKVVAERS